MRRDLTGFLLSPLFLLSLRKRICPTPPHPQARDAAHNKEGAQHSWGAPECCTTPPQTPHSRTLFTPLPTQHGVRAPLPLPYPQRRPDSIPRLLPHPEAPQPNHPPEQKFLPGGVTHTFFGGGKPPPAARPRLAALLAGLPHLQPSLLPISEPSHPALFPSPIVPDKPKPAVPPRAPPPSRRRAQPSPRSVCLSVRRSLRPFRAPCALPPPPRSPFYRAAAAVIGSLRGAAPSAAPLCAAASPSPGGPRCPPAPKPHGRPRPTAPPPTPPPAFRHPPWVRCCARSHEGSGVRIPPGSARPPPQRAEPRWWMGFCWGLVGVDGVLLGLGFRLKRAKGGAGQRGGSGAGSGARPRAPVGRGRAQSAAIDPEATHPCKPSGCRTGGGVQQEGRCGVWVPSLRGRAAPAA